MTTDPRLMDWRSRAYNRTDEAVRAVAQVPCVVAVIVGGSVGRGEHWLLSDIDLITVSETRSPQDVAAEVDMCAYQMSEMWGTCGIYTAVDAGKLTFDSTEADALLSGSADNTAAALSDPRIFHSIDKMFGGYTAHDPQGIRAALLDLSARCRFADLARLWSKQPSSNGNYAPDRSDVSGPVPSASWKSTTRRRWPNRSHQPVTRDPAGKT